MAQPIVTRAGTWVDFTELNFGQENAAKLHSAVNRLVELAKRFEFS